MASVSELQTLQRVFTFFKRSDGTNLPTGCTQLELIDDDDLTNWFVQLHYVDENKDDFFVSLRLCFLESGASSMASARSPPVVMTTRMPLVFVVSPRLVASFIHHGAICSLELMSTTWELNTTNMTLLLLALVETLNPFSNGSRVTVDSVERGEARRAAAAAAAVPAPGGRGGDSPSAELPGPGPFSSAQAYSEDEHADGMAYIQKAHPHLFRARTAGSHTPRLPTVSSTAGASANHAETAGTTMLSSREGMPALTEDASRPAGESAVRRRPLRTFADVRDAVLTALEESEERNDTTFSGSRTHTCHVSIHTTDVLLSTQQDKVDEVVNQERRDTELVPPSSLSPSPSAHDVPQCGPVPADTCAVPHRPHRDELANFLKGHSPVDVFASTAWKTVLPTHDQNARRAGQTPAADSPQATVSSAATPLARRRSVNEAPQRLCPLWIPLQLSPHNSEYRADLATTNTTATRASEHEEEQQREFAVAHETVASGAVVIARLVADDAVPAQTTSHRTVFESQKRRIHIHGGGGEDCEDDVLISDDSHEGTTYANQNKSARSCSFVSAYARAARVALCLWNVTRSSDSPSRWTSESGGGESGDCEACVLSANPHKPCRAQRVHVPTCTVPAGLALVLTDCYLYGHLRVLGEVELIRCTLVGSAVVEGTGRVCLRESEFAVCPDPQLFWTCAPFATARPGVATPALHSAADGDGAGGDDQDMRYFAPQYHITVPNKDGGDALARVIFGPWHNDICKDTDTSNDAGQQQQQQGGGELAGAIHLPPFPPQARPPPPQPLVTRREGVLIVDAGTVELDLGTRLCRLASLPVPVCVLDESERAALLAWSGCQPNTNNPSVAEVGQWIGVVCSECGVSCAVPLSVPRVSVLRAFILVSNQGRLRLFGVHMNPGVGAERAIFAEQDAMVDALNSTVFAGIQNGVSIQGCRGHLEGVLLIGTGVYGTTATASAAEDEQLPAGMQETRCSGLNVELGGILTARFCVIRHVFFGFSVIAHSVAHLDGCHAEDVVNGFTIDASRATLHNCSAHTNHVGVFALHQAKCTLSDDRYGAFSSRVTHLADAWARGRDAVYEKQQKQHRRCSGSVTYGDVSCGNTSIANVDSHHERDQCKESKLHTREAHPKKPWWCSAKFIDEVYDVLPPEQADEAYIMQMSKLFGAYFFRASMRRRVGLVEPIGGSWQGINKVTHADEAERELAQSARTHPGVDEAHEKLSRRSDHDEGDEEDQFEEEEEDGDEEAGVLHMPGLFGNAAGDSIGANGMRVLCAFIGGRFGLEVRGATVEADNLTILDFLEAAVYAYEGGSVTLSNTLIWVSPLQAMHTTSSAPPASPGKVGPDSQPEHSPPQTSPREHSANLNGQNIRETSSPPPAPPRQVPTQKTLSRVSSQPFAAAAATTSSSSAQASPLPSPSSRTCGVKAVAAEVRLQQCLTIQCTFGFAAVRGAALMAESCMALDGMNGFTIDASSCQCRHCGADTDQVGVFVLNHSFAKLSGVPHKSGLGSAERSVPKLICGGFPAMYGGRLYGIESQSSRLEAVGIIVVKGADSAFNLHNNSHAVLRQCLASLSAEDVRQFILKQARRTKGTQPGTSCLAPDGTAPTRDTHGSDAVEEDVRARTQADSGSLLYDNMRRVSVLSMPISHTATRSTGVKVWASSHCEVDEVEVRCVVFAYAAMGPDSSFDAHHCVARHVVNGFVVESASAELSKCSVSCSHVGVSVSSHGRCVLRRGTYTSKRHGLESRGGVLQIVGHVKVFGFELVGVLLREHAHLSTDKESFLEVKAIRPSSTTAAAARASVTAHAAAQQSQPNPDQQHGSGVPHMPSSLCATVTTTATTTTTTTASLAEHDGVDHTHRASWIDALAPNNPVPLVEPDLFPVCLSLAHASANISQGDLGGGAACGVRCQGGAQLTLRLTRIAGCTAVGLDLLDGGQAQLRSCSVQCIGRCALVVRRGGECRVTRAREDDPAELVEAERLAAQHAQARLAAAQRAQGGLLTRACRAGRRWLELCIPLPFTHASLRASSASHSQRTGPTTASGGEDRLGGGAQHVHAMSLPPPPPRVAIATKALSFFKAHVPAEGAVKKSWLEWLAAETEGVGGGGQHTATSVSASSSLASPPPPRRFWFEEDKDEDIMPNRASLHAGHKEGNRHSEKDSAFGDTSEAWARHSLQQGLDCFPAFCVDLHAPSPSAMRDSAASGSIWMEREGWRAPVLCTRFSTRTGVCVGENEDGAMNDVTGAFQSDAPTREEAADKISSDGPREEGNGTSSVPDPVLPSSLGKSPPPQPPRWPVGVSGAVYVHGLCVCERLVMQPSLLDPPRPSTRVTPVCESGRRRCRSESGVGVASARTYTLSPADQLSRAGRRESDRQQGHARHLHGHALGKPQAEARTPPSPPQDSAMGSITKTEKDHSAQDDIDATVMPPAAVPIRSAVCVTGLFRLKECVLLCSEALTGDISREETEEEEMEATVMVFARGPTAEIHFTHVHVGRQQGLLESPLPSGSLLLESKATPQASSHHHMEWFSWPSVALTWARAPTAAAVVGVGGSSEDSLVNVVPRWLTCQLLCAQDGAMVSLDHVRPLLSRLQQLPTPPRGAPAHTSTAFSSVSSSSLRPQSVASHELHQLALTPFSGALKLVVCCERGPAEHNVSVERRCDADEDEGDAGDDEENKKEVVMHAAHVSPLLGLPARLLARPQPQTLTVLAVANCTLGHLSAFGCVSRVLLTGTLITPRPASVAGADAAVSVRCGARVLDWGCLLVNRSRQVDRSGDDK